MSRGARDERPESKPRHPNNKPSPGSPTAFLLSFDTTHSLALVRIGSTNFHPIEAG
ncbi:hypothetical protein HMPREF9154_2545 [Arachnia propionica F0230a]|nr:hypothetical protein HMPREF9154_2545 [Arachnia propionica F0230a]